jgi:hypothetical protein
MSKDPIERLRRANPLPDTPAAPPIEPLLVRLADRGPGNEGKRRRAGAVARSGFRTAPVALAALVSVVIAVVALSLLKHASPSGPVPSSTGWHVLPGLPPVPSLSPGDMHALDYHWRTRPHVPVRGNVCSPSPGSPPVTTPSAHDDQAAPSQALLGDYAVLQSPQTSATTLPASFGGGAWSKYGRVAQRRYGSAIAVIPDRYAPPPGRPLTTRCETGQLAAQRKDLAGAPAALIGRALRIDRESFEDERYLQLHPDGICVLIDGSGSCGAFLDAQARGSLTSVRYGSHGSLNAYLVPNGVDKVAVQYASERSSKTSGPILPPLIITVPVVNNVAVWTVSNRSNLVSPHAVAWLADNGHTLRTAYP